MADLRRRLVWYAAFILALLITFLIRACLDLSRAALARDKNQDKILEFCKWANEIGADRALQQHFWRRLSQEIGSRFLRCKELAGTDAMHLALIARMEKLNYADDPIKVGTKADAR